MPSDGGSGEALVLGFDTSAAQCAAALVSGGRVLARAVEPMARGQAERLLPMLERVLAEAGAGWSDLAGVAVCTGPGNFTGLRLSVAAARGLALGLGVPGVGVTRFEALAHGVPGLALVTVEAPQGRLYAQLLRDGAPDDGAPVVAAPEALEVPPQAYLVGDGAEALGARLGLAVCRRDSVPDPGVVAIIAAGRLADAARPVPLYLREADAAPAAEQPPLLLEDAPR